jgi:ATP-dependent protease ClpP protease subunit
MPKEEIDKQVFDTIFVKPENAVKCGLVDGIKSVDEFL